MEQLTAENPFFNRGCIEDARFFFGRERELREVFNLLGKSTPQSVSIVGQRKIGKSSFLQHIRREEVMRAHGITPGDFVMVALNFEGLAYLSELECLQKLMWDTHTTLAQAGIYPGEALKIDLSAATPMRVIDGLNRLFAYLKKQKKRLIYVFDEFEISCGNAHLSISFFNTLRSFATNYGVAYVVATRQELWRLPHYRLGRSSPFFNYFTTIFLGEFEEEEARALIASGSLLDQTAYLLENAGLFPFFLQMLCWYVYDKQVRGALNESDLTDAYLQFQAQVTGYFEYFWSTLTEEERSVLGALAEKRPILASESALVEGLQRKVLLRNQGGRPVLFCEALRHFVRAALGRSGEAALRLPA